ncbi:MULTISPECIES: hypothetical protein [unclassified Methylophaga]|nr:MULTISPECIES: hypothetical protein [unclassified Methylophaga]MAL51022.1 hypothetical protein [Methylophaga sp.]MBP23912.1 hypothetical protein [Methylophaga sp.]HCC82261.1 hypothetical protein [Methylophaga sp.]
MGWSYSTQWRSKKQLVEYLTDSYRFGENQELLKSSVVGNNHWYLAKLKTTGEIWIGLDMMQSGREDGWGYKDLTASCGPVVVNCPLSFLKAASTPEPDSFDAKWRERVIAYHESKKLKAKRNLEPGVVVEYGGNEYALEEPAGPRMGWYVNRLPDKRRFRMSARQLGQAEIRGANH